MDHQIAEARLIKRPAFQAVGIRWEGTFAEADAGGIRILQEQFKKRLSEIQGAVQTDVLLGLSYHAFPAAEGFVHYAAVKLGEQDSETLPEGMTGITVPELDYACCFHRKGQSIDLSYKNLYAWIGEQGMKEAAPEGLTHYEEYPMSQDPYDRDPEFAILIPVERAL